MSTFDKLHNIINQKVDLIAGDKDRFLNMCRKAANDNKYLLNDIKEKYTYNENIRITVDTPIKKVRKKA